MADPWEGLRQTSNPLASAARTASTPSMTYSPLRDPSGPLARAGWIGALMANGPTKQEYLMHQQGQARGTALDTLQSFIDRGMSPQQALAAFMQSPDGVNFFTNDPGGLDTLTGYLSSVTPPKPERQVLSPGQSMVDEQTGALVARVPTTKAQELTDVGELAQLAPNEMAAIARASLIKDQTGNDTENERAVGRLVSVGAISQETGDRLLSGALKAMPLLDQYGRTIGYTAFDVTSGQQTLLQPGNDTTGAPGAGPSSQGAAGAGLPELPQTGVNPEIVGATGFGPALERFLGGGFAQIDTQSAPVVAESMANGLAAVRFAAQNMRRSARATGADVKIIEEMLGGGWMTSPPQMAQNLLDWYDYLARARAAAEQTINDPQASVESKKEASDEINNIRQAFAPMPQKRQELVDFRDKLINEPDSPLATSFSRIFKQIGKVLPEAEKQFGDLTNEALGTPGAPTSEQSPSFASTSEAQAAYERGEIKIGDVVVIDGQAMKVGE